jgi:hypothetical protein
MLWPCPDDTYELSDDRDTFNGDITCIQLQLAFLEFVVYGRLQHPIDIQAYERDISRVWYVVLPVTRDMVAICVNPFDAIRQRIERDNFCLKNTLCLCPPPQRMSATFPARVGTTAAGPTTTTLFHRVPLPLRFVLIPVNSTFHPCERDKTHVSYV